eukprot:21064-Pyramimonas_sp.AAC.1
MHPRAYIPYALTTTCTTFVGGLLLKPLEAGYSSRPQAMVAVYEMGKQAGVSEAASYRGSEADPQTSRSMMHSHRQALSHRAEGAQAASPAVPQIMAPGSPGPTSGSFKDHATH